MGETVRINIGTVTAVLLADGWHDVRSGTCEVGEIAFVNDDGTLIGHIGRPQAIQWTDRGDGSQITCPLPAVQGIKALEDPTRTRPEGTPPGPRPNRRVDLA